MENNEKFQMASSGLLPFDPIVLIQDIAKRWLVILVLSLIVGMGTYIITDATYAPTYQSGATLVVTTRSASGTVYNALSSTSTLASVFTEMVNSSVFRKTVLEDAGIYNFTGRITASAVTDTNLLTMQVTASDPRTAFLVAQAVLGNHQTITHQVIGDVALEVLQKPTVSVSPSNANPANSRMRLAILLTAAVSCLTLGYISFHRDMVRSGSEVRQKLDCWYLGEIQHERRYKTLRALLKKQHAGILITEPATSFRFAEAIQKLRHRVEQRMDKKKVLMVTSVLENEGKSTVSINLALAMARKHRKVLLIDCDLRKPACAKILKVNWTQSGVRAVLEGYAEASDLIVYDRRTGLHLLLEQSGTQKSGELIGSARMGQLLEQVRQDYDTVILDLPPMGAVTDAEAIADLVDASLLVVRQNAAAAPVINKVLTSLNNAKSRMLGCVLNNVYSTDFFSGQGYGYGSYGKYGRYGKYGSYGKYGAYNRYAKNSDHQNS